MEKKFEYEGGEKVYHLREVTVTGSTKTKDDHVSICSGMGKPIEVEEIAKNHIWHTALDVVASFPGVFITRDDKGKEAIMVRGNAVSLLVVDDVPISPDGDIVDMLKSMYVESVGSVNVLSGPETAIFGFRGGGGVILVRYKRGSDFRPNNETSPSLAIIRPLGHYQPAAFYSPKYQTPEQIKNQTPDLRTTIYWNPSISIRQKQSAQLSFYTADRPGSYTITVEGLTSSGEPLHVTSKLIVKDR